MDTRVFSRMISSCKTMVIGSCFAVIVFSVGIFAYTGNSFKLAVTYYSFHENSIEFGSAGALPTAGVTVKLRDSLDVESKPVVDPKYVGDSAATGWAQYVGRWFRPWRTGNPLMVYAAATPHKKDSTGCHYDQTMLDLGLDSATAWMCNYTYDTIPAGYVACDTCMKNIAIKDSIAFTLTAGTYNGATHQFYTMTGGALKGGAAWNPIAGRGIDPDIASMMMFTMECHYTFTYHNNPAPIIIMDSDDDSWFFIKNHDALDLGGLRNGPQDTLDLSTLGLTNGQVYNADFFFANRGQGSRFYLKTDIDFTAPRALGTVKDNGIIRNNGKQISFGKNSMMVVPEATTAIEYSIVDALGRVVSRAHHSFQSSSNVPLAALPNGLYFVKSVCKNGANKTIATVANRIFIGR